MAKEATHTVIDGVEYTFNMLPATRCWKMTLRLAKMLGPSLGKVADGLLSGEGGSELNARDLLNVLMEGGREKDFIGDAVVALTQSFGEAEVEYIIEELKEMTYIKNGGTKLVGGVFDLHFQGEPWKIVKWLREALKAQLSPSSGGLQNDAGQDASLDAA